MFSLTFSLNVLQFWITAFSICGSRAAQSTTQRADCLLAHNEVRRSVWTITNAKSRPVALRYNITLEEAACKWSKFLADNGKFQHSGSTLGWFGENLWKVTYSRPSTSSLLSCRAAANSWASEAKFYRPGFRIGIDGVFSQYGHYSQMVWPSTKFVGCCGWKSPDARSVVWTCEYSSP